MIRQKPSFIVNDYRGRQYSIVEIVTIADDDRKGEIETSSTLLTAGGQRVFQGKTKGEYWIEGIGAAITVPLAISAASLSATLTLPIVRRRYPKNFVAS